MVLRFVFCFAKRENETGVTGKGEFFFEIFFGNRGLQGDYFAGAGDIEVEGRISPVPNGAGAGDGGGE